MSEEGAEGGERAERVDEKSMGRHSLTCTLVARLTTPPFSTFNTFSTFITLFTFSTFFRHRPRLTGHLLHDTRHPLRPRTASPIDTFSTFHTFSTFRPFT